MRKEIFRSLSVDPRIAPAVFLLLSAGLTLFLFGHAVSGFWRYDDTQLLKHAWEYSPRQFFSDPAASRTLQPFNLNPFISLSFSLDLRLFGMDPKWFYIRHLLTLWISALSVALLLGLWVPPGWAYMGGILYLFGSPLTIIADQLMCRHYLEGLIFSSLSIFFFVCRIRGYPWWASVASGLCYFAAISSKEVYVPLLLVMPAIPEGTLGRRIRAAGPLFLLVIAYIPWRHYMLESYLGGMGLPVRFENLYLLPVRFWEYLYGPAQIPAMILFLSSLGWYAWKSRFNLILPLICLLVLLGPLIPISSIIIDTDRFFLPSWWCLCLATILLGHGIISRFSKAYLAIPAVLLILSGGALWKSSQTQRQWAPVHREFDIQGRFLWESKGADVVLLSPRMSRNFWYVAGLDWLKKKNMPQSRTVKVCVDEIEYPEMLPSGMKIWRYHPGTQRMEDAGEYMAAGIQEWKAKTRSKPLSLSLRFDPQGKYFDWQFGPYEKGRYLVITDSGGLWELPKDGRIRSDIQNGFHFFLRYDDPDGWITYSDRLYLDPISSQPIQWRRLE